MSHFKIFIPGVHGNKPEHLENIGLGDMFSGCFMHQHPGGERAENGMLVSWATAGTTLEFQSEDPDDIEWIKAVLDGIYKAERYWVLIDKTSLPKPHELERQKTHPGQSYMLNDGSEWLITSPANLPQAMKLNEEGKWIFEMKEEYRPYIQECEKRFLELQGEVVKENGEFSYGDACEAILESLRLNYRITREVVSYLKLFSSETIAESYFEAVGISNIVRNTEMESVQ